MQAGVCRGLQTRCSPYYIRRGGQVRFLSVSAIIIRGIYYFMETLYSCRRECCPEMFFDGEKGLIIIKDDEGGLVSLTKAQFEALRDAYGARFSMEGVNDRA